MQDYEKFETEFNKNFENLKKIDLESSKLRKIIEIKEAGNKAILNDLTEKLGIGSFFVLGEIEKLNESLHQKLDECRKAKDEELKNKYHKLFVELLNYSTNR